MSVLAKMALLVVWESAILLVCAVAWLLYREIGAAALRWARPPLEWLHRLVYRR